MALELISIGSAPDANDGDTARAWATKSNTNVGRQAEVYNVVAGYGAAANGTTDDAAAIQAAIDAANTAGGGTVFLPQATYAIASTLTLKERVEIVGVGTGTVIKWTGATGGTMFATTSVNPTRWITFRDLLIDPQTTFAGTVFNLHSPQRSQFRNLFIEESSTSSITLHIDATVTNAGTEPANKNASQNIFSNIRGRQCGTFLEMSGTAPGEGTCTLNYFENLDGQAENFGIRLVQQVDNTTFGGMIRAHITGNNGIGMICNDSATPTTEVNVKSVFMKHLAVDTFAGGQTGRVGLKLNACRQIFIEAFFQTPVAEGGIFVPDATADKYFVNIVSGAGLVGSLPEIYKKNILEAGTTRRLGSSDTSILWQTDGSGNIGAPTTSRPASIYASTEMAVGAQQTILGIAGGGGDIRLLRKTSLPGTLGATYGRIYFRDGTDAGTLKLVVRAGSGAETTILDNIPTV